MAQATDLDVEQELEAVWPVESLAGTLKLALDTQDQAMSLSPSQPLGQFFCWLRSDF